MQHLTTILSANPDQQWAGRIIMRGYSLNPRQAKSLWWIPLRLRQSRGSSTAGMHAGELRNKPSAQLSVAGQPFTRRRMRACRGLKLNTILNTHHHHDHTGGNLELKSQHGCQIVGPQADHDRIPGIDVALADGDTWKFGSLEMRVFDTPGHTKGHITLWFPAAEALFPGELPTSQDLSAHLGRSQEAP